MSKYRRIFKSSKERYPLKGVATPKKIKYPIVLFNNDVKKVVIAFILAGILILIGAFHG
jgi:hypothetical protein